MLDLWPRPILKLFHTADKKYFCYVVTAIGVALVGIFYNTFIWQQSQVLSSGYSFFSNVRAIAHYGRCPLCGGTRSFLSLFSGNFLQALHYNIFGTLFFLTIYVLLPFRIAIASGLNNRLLELVKDTDLFIQRNIIYIILTIYFLQLGLDYLGIFSWLA